MKLTNNYKRVAVATRAPEKTGGESVFTVIQRSLNQVASRVGSTLGVEKKKNGAVFYLEHRPKDRQGRLDWDREVEKVSADCRASTRHYTPSIIVARNGYELEIKRK